MSDRDLVSYAGGWSVSHRILNVSTRQIMLSDTLRDQLPPTEPTTIDRGVDGTQLIADMETEVVSRTVSAILSRTFPLVVVSKDGTNVILSQGGQSVKVGASYAIVLMGKEMKDPQTGESLGRTESPCCDVVIDRIANKLAYGHLENVKIALDSVDPVGLQVRDELKSPVTAASSIAEPSAQSPPVSPPTAKQQSATVQNQVRSVPMPPAEASGADDSKKW